MSAVSTWHLRVIIDDNLNFREHISQGCRTCYRRIRDLQHIRLYWHFLLQLLLQLHWLLVD